MPSDDDKSNISPGREIHDYPSHWQFESGTPLETDTAQHIYDPLQLSQSMAPLVPSTVFEEQGAPFVNISGADTVQHIYDPLQFSQFMTPLVPSTVFEEQGASFADLPEAYDPFQFSHHVFHSPLDKTYQYSQPVIA